MLTPPAAGIVAHAGVNRPGGHARCAIGPSMPTLADDVIGRGDACGAASVSMAPGGRRITRTFASISDAPSCFAVSDRTVASRRGTVNDDLRPGGLAGGAQCLSAGCESLPAGAQSLFTGCQGLPAGAQSL